MRTRKLSISLQKGRIPKDENLVSLQDKRRLIEILDFGFGVGDGYKLSRDRHYVNLCTGTTDEALLDFCSRHLNGSPIPGKDPSEGNALLKMFRAAERKGLVTLEFLKADQFIPESGK